LCVHFANPFPPSPTFRSLQLLPFNHTDQALALRSYVVDLEELLARKNRTLDLRPLHGAVALYADAAALAAEEAAFLQDQAALDVSTEAGGERLRALNDRLAFTERRFLSPPGLPRRPWFKHVGQAPGLYLGYGAETLPAVTQALNDNQIALAQQQVLEAADRIKDAALFLAGRGGDEEEAEPAVMDVQ
jgi:N-acetylated-alpha-linked acidic dipeptidase